MDVTVWPYPETKCWPSPIYFSTWKGYYQWGSDCAMLDVNQPWKHELELHEIRRSGKLRIPRPVTKGTYLIWRCTQVAACLVDLVIVTWPNLFLGSHCSSSNYNQFCGMCNEDTGLSMWRVLRGNRPELGTNGKCQLLILEISLKPNWGSAQLSTRQAETNYGKLMNRWGSGNAAVVGLFDWYVLSVWLWFDECWLQEENTTMEHVGNFERTNLTLNGIWSAPLVVFLGKDLLAVSWGWFVWNRDDPSYNTYVLIMSISNIA